MIRPRVVAIATGLLVAGTVAVAQAQTENKHKREGFWFALSAGAASVGVSCDGCSDDRQIGRLNMFAGNPRLSKCVDQSCGFPVVLRKSLERSWSGCAYADRNFRNLRRGPYAAFAAYAQDGLIRQDNRHRRRRLRKHR